MSNYTGDLIGNITGNVLGNVSGDLDKVTNVSGNLVIVGGTEGSNLYGDCNLSNNMVVDGGLNMNGFINGNIIGSVTGNNINLIGNLQLNGNTIGTLPINGDIISTDSTKSIIFNNLKPINNTDTLYISTSFGETIIRGDTTIDGSLNVTSIINNLDISGNINILGNTVIKNDLAVKNNVDISGNVNIMGTTILQDNVTINNEMFVNNNLTTVGDNLLLGSIFVSESSTLNDDVMIGGSLDVINDITLNNNLSVGNEFNVEGTTYLNDTNIYGSLQPAFIKDYYDSSGNNGQILTSTNEHIKWKNLPIVTSGTNIMVDNTNYDPIINLNITSDLNLNNNNLTNVNIISGSNITVSGDIIIPNLQTTITNSILYIDNSGNLTQGNQQINPSDIKLKTNIKDFSFNNTFSKIKSLQLKSYDWIENNTHDFGYIAQDIEKFFPEAITPISNQLLGINKQYMNYLNLEATKELILENDKLKDIISEQNTRLEYLEEIVKKLITTQLS